MKLQINNTGAWKTLIHFHLDYDEDVRLVATQLLGLSEPGTGDKTTLRIASDDGLALAHATSNPDSGEWEWKEARR